MRALHLRWRRFVHLATRHARPRWKLGAAALLGAVIGCSPLFGLHLLLCVLAGRLLRLNILAMYAAANISIPPLAPLVGFASVQVGHQLRHGSWMPLDFGSREPAALAAEFFIDWALGGLVVGLVAGAVLAAIAMGIARARDARSPRVRSVRASVRSAAARYRPFPRGVRSYASGKLAFDPAPRAIARLVPAGARVADLGAGIGLISVLLAARGARVVAVEHDERKVAILRAAASGLDVTPVLSNMVSCNVDSCDYVLLVDVLHYLDGPTVQLLLERCAAAITPGGALLIRDQDASHGGGAGWTRALERWSVKRGVHRAGGVTFHSAASLVSRLRELGLHVRSIDLSGPFLPGNVLFIARKHRAHLERAS